MRKVIYFIIFVLFSNALFTQTDKNKINGYKYAILETNDYEAKNILKKIGISTYFKNDSIPENVYNNPCQTLHISFKDQHIKNPSKRNSIYHYSSSIIFKNCLKNDFLVLTKGGITFDRSQKKLFKILSKFKYSYDPSFTPKIKSSTNEKINSNWWNNVNEEEYFIDSKDIISEDVASKDIGFKYAPFNLKDENEIREYFDKNARGIEGVWEYTGGLGSDMRLAFVYEDFKYNAIALEKKGIFNIGSKKAALESTATESVFTINFKDNNGRTIRCLGKLKTEGLIEFKLPVSYNRQGVKSGGERFFYKVYPKISSKKIVSKNEQWLSSGSGIIISKSGYLVTNNHVIEDAEEIEIEFILNEEVQKFNAEVIQSDKVNDLAVIKIVDINFDGVDEPPYNFKTTTSDVGTKVYAFGYPMALTSMGKEIKITEGIISSKSGFEGDITTYQISAPIQSGNSGGPLFDENGNLLGINSSGIRKDVADNVGYTIKSSYILNLIDVLPKSIDLPSSTKLESSPITEQIKEISKYVVLIKVK